jgi:hypothetical protein
LFTGGGKNDIVIGRGKKEAGCPDAAGIPLRAMILVRTFSTTTPIWSVSFFSWIAVFSGLIPIEILFACN